MIDDDEEEDSMGRVKTADGRRGEKEPGITSISTHSCITSDQMTGKLCSMVN